MKAEKGRKRKMSRKQFVLIEWTILLVIIVGLIVGGICLVRRHAGKTDRKDLQQSE
jgi:high-affinity Fe2+/Pb2+ permease